MACAFDLQRCVATRDSRRAISGAGDRQRAAQQVTGATATQNQVRQTPREQLQDGGTFTWPIDSFPRNFNYHELDGTDVGTAQIDVRDAARAVHHRRRRHSDLEPRPAAPSAPVLATEPRQVVTYDINPKAAWYDGTPITWEDFYWQWRASRGTDKAYQICFRERIRRHRKRRTGQDDREVVVTFKRRYSDWQAIFSQLYPASTNKDPKDLQ